MDDSERPNDEMSSGKKRFRSEVIVAIAAIVVSLLTLFVYIFQARIMVNQQHTSVWPHLEVEQSFTSTDVEQEYYLAVINKGVGPALVKKTSLTLDGKEYRDYKEMMGELLGDTTMRNSLWIVYSGVDNRVLAPGDHIKLIHVKNWKEARIPDFDRKRFSFSVCYCNIYDDCWSTDGTEAGNCE